MHNLFTYKNLQSFIHSTDADLEMKLSVGTLLLKDRMLEILLKHKDSNNFFIKCYLAEHPDTPRDIIEKLVKDENYTISMCARHNTANKIIKQ